MCRYGLSGPYKRHFACFRCRKGFKRSPFPDNQPLNHIDPAPCPDCGRKMFDMGLDFKPLKRTDTEHWAVVEFLSTNGFLYHSCGCGGPGYRPSRWSEVPAFLESHRCQTAGDLLATRFASRAKASR